MKAVWVWWPLLPALAAAARYRWEDGPARLAESHRISPSTYAAGRPGIVHHHLFSGTIDKI